MGDGVESMEEAEARIVAQQARRVQTRSLAIAAGVTVVTWLLS